MAVVPVIEVLAAALEAFAAVPRVYEATKEILPRLKTMIARGEGRIVIEGPLGTVVEGETKKLDGLIKDYYAKDQDPRYGALEKDEYRQKLAAQICRLLEKLGTIKDKIPYYDVLRELFCQRFTTS